MIGAARHCRRPILPGNQTRRRASSRESSSRHGAMMMPGVFLSHPPMPTRPSSVARGEFNGVGTTSRLTSDAFGPWGAHRDAVGDGDGGELHRRAAARLARCPSFRAGDRSAGAVAVRRSPSACSPRRHDRFVRDRVFFEARSAQIRIRRTPRALGPRSTECFVACLQLSRRKFLLIMPPSATGRRRRFLSSHY